MTALSNKSQFYSLIPMSISFARKRAQKLRYEEFAQTEQNFNRTKLGKKARYILRVVERNKGTGRADIGQAGHSKSMIY